MLKVGADNAATGENAVVVGCRTADIIVGPVGIAIADSLLGEITPKMATAVGQSNANRILIPINHCNNIIIGVEDLNISKLIEAVITEIRKRLDSTTVHGVEEESMDVHHQHEYEHNHEYNHEHNQEHGHEHGHHHHSGLHDIEHIVRGHLKLSQKVQDDIMDVYMLIAEAESKAHGKPVTEVHFHEVGTMDAIADITAVCMLMNKIAPDQIVVSPVHVGSGQVKCAHGILPVPAPATVHILRDVPIYGGHIRGELCTPTGAALLKHFAARFGDMPVMTTKTIGYGMGKKDFEAANCVRVLLGETADTGDTVSELFCNIDDMTAEAISFATEVLFSAGALEVYTVPVGMKKSRPGTLLCTMCRVDDKDKMIQLIFKHTTTIGIREQISNRYTLNRSIESVETSYGTVRKKISSGYGVQREKYEYEDLAGIARNKDISIADVRSDIGKN